MARIEFVPDLVREGACGTWSAIVLADGGRCAAMRLPVQATDHETIDRILAVTRQLMAADVPGIAPVAVVAVGGDQVWVFVGIAPGPSVADLLYESPLTAAELGRIALDSGHTLAGLHEAGLHHGSFGPEAVVISRTGRVQVTEAGIGPALGADHATDHVSRERARRTDVAAWAYTVRRFGDHLRAARAGDIAEVFAACADAAESAGLLAAIERLDEGVRGLNGYPGRDGLADAMRRYSMSEEPDTATVLHAIDALFEADAREPEPVPEPEPARTPIFGWPRSPLRHKSRSPGGLAGSAVAGTAVPAGTMTNGTATDGAVTSGAVTSGAVTSGAVTNGTMANGAVTNGATTNGAFANGMAHSTAVNDPDAGGDGAAPNGAVAVTTMTAIDPAALAAPIVDEPVIDEPVIGESAAAEDTAERAALATAVVDDETATALMDDDSATAIIDDPEGAETALLSPPVRMPRKTSAIPLRRPRPPNGETVEAPRGLWAPSAAPRTSTPVRSPVEDDDSTIDETVRVGHGVPASNGRRPVPARLGRPVWWPRLAMNLVLVGLIALGVGGYVWWRVDRPLHITAVSLTVEKHVATSCQLDADVVGTVITSGGKGTFTYLWRRSDGTTTSVYTAHVADPGKPTEVHLEWTFNGAGQETAQVELQVLSPQRRTASTSFEYLCGSS